METTNENLFSLVDLRVNSVPQVKTDDNRADHFTKALPLAAFRNHTDYMLGMRFITTQHAAAVARRNNETFGSRGGGMWQSDTNQLNKTIPVPNPDLPHT
jgi:hypothetical protein